MRANCNEESWSDKLRGHSRTLAQIIGLSPGSVRVVAIPPPDLPPVYWRRGDEDDPSILGRSTDALFILDEAGTVWLVPEGTAPRRFVNSSTNRFYEAMAALFLEQVEQGLL